MSDGRKRILSRFTGCKKSKAWGKTREKYIPVKRRQILAETDRGVYLKEECLEEPLDSKPVLFIQGMFRKIYFCKAEINLFK